MLRWRLDGDAVCKMKTEITHRAFPNHRLGAATSLGGIAQYGTERTGRVESASDGNERGVSSLASQHSEFANKLDELEALPHLTEEEQLEETSLEEIETPPERSDGSDREPVQVSAGSLNVRCAFNGNRLVFPARSRSRGRVFHFWL